MQARFSTLVGKRIAILGLTFKPNTDDLREAASIDVINRLIELGAEVVCYDPVAMDHARKIWCDKVEYAENVSTALYDSDVALLLTELNEFKEMDVQLFRLMRTPIVFDGRNCYVPEIMAEHQIEYYAIGRPDIVPVSVI